MMWTMRPFATPAGTRGAAFSGANLLYLWGDDGVWRMRLPEARAERLAGGAFGPVGGVSNVLGSGPPDLILTSGEDLLLLDASNGYRVRRVDSGVDAADCMGAVILGHRGVLATHRGLQVRHYTPPADPRAPRWPYREIYSFYTASYQAGLVLHDVDGDGRPDLFCGNYWIRSPKSYDLSWRLFAIQTWNEEPLSARMRLAWTGSSLVVAQGAMPDARLAVFRPPPDRTQLWTEQRLDAGAPLRRPMALAASRDFFVVGESEGAAPRLMEWSRDGRGEWAMRVIHSGQAFHSAWIRKEGVWAFGPGGVFLFSGRPIQ